MEPPARPKTPILLYQQNSIKKHLKKNPEVGTLIYEIYI